MMLNLLLKIKEEITYHITEDELSDTKNKSKSCTKNKVSGFTALRDNACQIKIINL